MKYLCEGYGIQPSDNLHFDFNLHDFSEPLESEKLKQRIKEQGYNLVIIDVLARYLPGLDENMVSSVGPVLTRLRQITDGTDATLLLIHHFNKGGLRNQAISQGMRIRGSSDIFTAVDTALTLVTKGSTRVLLPVKNRMGQVAEPLSFMLVKGEKDAISLDFLANEESKGKTSYGTMVGVTLHTIMKILIVKAGSYFMRGVLEDLLVDFGPVPSQRTLDKVFVLLSSQPGVRVERKGHFKYYSYVREEEESSDEASVIDEAEPDEEIGNHVTEAGIDATSTCGAYVGCGLEDFTRNPYTPDIAGSHSDSKPSPPEMRGLTLPLQDWKSEDEAAQVERVKQMMKKVLYPKLDEMQQMMREELEGEK